MAENYHGTKGEAEINEATRRIKSTGPALAAAMVDSAWKFVPKSKMASAVMSR
jgi:hypothetical protein